MACRHAFRRLPTPTHSRPHTLFRHTANLPYFQRRTWCHPASLETNTIKHELKRRSLSVNGDRDTLLNRLSIHIEQRGGSDNGLTLDENLIQLKQEILNSTRKIGGSKFVSTSLHAESRHLHELSRTYQTDRAVKITYPKDSSSIQIEGTYSDVFKVRTDLAQRISELASNETLYALARTFVPHLKKAVVADIEQKSGAKLRLLRISSRQDVYLMTVTGTAEARMVGCTMLEELIPMLKEDAVVQEQKSRKKRTKKRYSSNLSIQMSEHLGDGEVSTLTPSTPKFANQPGISLYVEPQYRGLWADLSHEVDRLSRENNVSIHQWQDERTLCEGEIAVVGNKQDVGVVRSYISDLISEFKKKEVSLVINVGSRAIFTKRYLDQLKASSRSEDVYLSSDTKTMRLHIFGDRSARNTAIKLIDEQLFHGSDQDLADWMSLIERKQRMKDLNLTEYGIGGLTDRISTLLRRTFQSRLISSELKRELGIQHMKGVLLYGPPGTGKTLIARRISDIIGCEDPIIINGPEVESKWVGEAEKNIRALFEAAEKDYAEKGERAKLHVIIFDEIDSIAKTRGGAHAKSRDGALNQLLCSLDGVKNIDNVLVFGLTNRKDTIDHALLRPGRLEVHLEVPLADHSGRVEIFNIHTESMRRSGRINSDVDMMTLADYSEGFSGAEIAGVTRSAVSFALEESWDDEDEVSVCFKHFEEAVTEVRDAKDNMSEELQDASTNYDGLLQS